MTVRFHRLAREELRSALDWYDDANAAARFRRAVETAVDRIEADPESHPVERGRYRWVRVRRFPYRLVFERLDGDTIRVIALVHARRRPGYWRHRK
ncbi:MAG: type II toxin-antitoxin system RelE/ParE family toxin [Planctomycetaceae bacterium]